MMSSDPRVPKSRQPKAYTDRQLDFLKSCLPEYETRSQGSIRGDSKKFAFQKAAEYIAQFGLATEFMTVEDGEARFKEQIYNWFKNTVGRNRRKAEGRTRSSAAAKKANGGDDKGVANGTGLSSGIPWNAGPSTSGLTPYGGLPPGDPGDGKHNTGGSSSASPVNPASGHVLSPIQYGSMHGLSGSSAMHAPHPASSSNTLPPNATPSNATHAHPPPPPTPHNAHTHSLAQLAAASMTANAGHHVLITPNTLREAFLTLDTSSITSLVQNYVAAQGAALTATPLTTVVEALFEASVADAAVGPTTTYNRDPHPFVRRYAEMSSYLPLTVVHAGCAGPAAGYRALQMQIRRNSIWAVGTRAFQQQQGASGSGTPSTGTTTTTTLSEDMQRIANERQRRKDHIQWARIHAASLELGMMGLGRSAGVSASSPEGDHQGFGYTVGRAFSEMVARDAVWEADEAEWVAGSFVLRAVIRTGIRGDRRQREEYGEMLRMYEGRWKEIKDEVRQTMVTEVLLSSKEELAKLDETLP